MKNKQLNILLVEDQHLVRQGFEELLLNRFYHQPPFIKHADSGKQAIEIVRQHHDIIDLILLDLRMEEAPGEEPAGLKVANFVKHFHRHIKVIVLSSEYNGKYIKTSFDLGVEGYLSKVCRGQEVQMAIEKIISGEMYYQVEMFQKMQEYVMKRPTIPELNERQAKLLILLANGYKVSEMPDELKDFIGDRMIERELRILRDTFAAHNSTHLVAQAFKEGILKKEHITRTATK